jgi:hypothetical protein
MSGTLRYGIGSGRDWQGGTSTQNASWDENRNNDAGVNVQLALSILIWSSIMQLHN